MTAPRPNPVQGLASIQWSGATDGTRILAVYDVAGRLVARESTNNQSRSGRTSWNDLVGREVPAGDARPRIDRGSNQSAMLVRAQSPW